MTAQTPSQRIAAYRARKRDAGLPELRGVYLPPELHPKVKAFAAKLLTPRGKNV